MAKTKDTVDQASTAPTHHVDSGEHPFLTPGRIKSLAIVGGVIVVVALVAWFMIASGRRKESFAAQALEQARATAASGNLADATQQYQQVTASYSGTDAARQAEIGIAQARMVAGQTELAISTLEDFVAGDVPDNYRSQAEGLLGTGYENVGNFDKAYQAYRKAADLAGQEYLKAALLLDAGRAAGLAGKRDQARQVYSEIISKYGDTAARSEAEVRLAELSAEPAIAPGAAGG